MGFNAMQPGKVKKADLIIAGVGTPGDHRTHPVGGAVTEGTAFSVKLDYCYLTTTGRHSGEPHRIEIWFALADGVAYLLSGSGGPVGLGSEPPDLSGRGARDRRREAHDEGAPGHGS